MNEYEIDGSISDREEDHLIPLQFGDELTGTEPSEFHPKESTGRKLKSSSEHHYP